MATENGEVVRDLYEAFARGDIPSVLAAFDSKIEWREAENFIYADGNPYVGSSEVLEGVFQRLATEWDGFAAVPDEIHAGEDAVVAVGYYTGVYRATGTAVRAQFAHVYKLREGKVVSFQQYTDTLQFHRAVGAAARGSTSAS